jgi:hypothetical protein
MSNNTQDAFKTWDRRLNHVVFAIVDLFIYVRHPLLVLRFCKHVGYWPRPAHPTRYSDKYLWRKLFDHDPRFTECSDKLRAKERVATKFPDIRVPQTFWEGDNPEQIPTSLLLRNCVVKANHGSGWNVLIINGEVDRQDLNRRARSWLKTVYYGRRDEEWGYKNIEPRLFVEQMIISGLSPVKNEYKCYVAGGRVIYAYVKIDRFGEFPIDSVIDRDGKSNKTIIDRYTVTTYINRPENWDRIVRAAEIIGAEFDFVRCDLYEIAGEIWFSEYTFYSLRGYASIEWPEINFALNAAWDIRRSWFLSTPQKGWRALYAGKLRVQLNAS